MGQFRKQCIPPYLGSSPGPHLVWFGYSSTGSLEDDTDDLRVGQAGLRGCHSSFCTSLCPAEVGPCGEEASPLLSETLANSLGKTVERSLTVLCTTSAVGMLVPVPRVGSSH